MKVGGRPLRKVGVVGQGSGGPGGDRWPDHLDAAQSALCPGLLHLCGPGGELDLTALPAGGATRAGRVAPSG